MLNRIHLVAAGVAMLSAGLLANGLYEELPEYNPETGNPVFRTGFGVRRNTYVNGRLTVMVSDLNGMTKMRYYSSDSGSPDIFNRSECETCAQNMRLDVFIDGIAWQPEFNNTEHWPFGYTSECTLDGVKLRHELVLDSNVVFQRIKVLDNPAKKEVKVRLAQHDCLSGEKTRWFLPDFKKDRLVGFIYNKAGRIRNTQLWSTNRIEIGACAPVEWPINWYHADDEEAGLRRLRNYRQLDRYFLKEKNAADTHVFYFALNPSADEDYSEKRIDAIYARFMKLRGEICRFRTGNPVVDSCLESVTPMFAFNEFTDRPGAFRAGYYYYVWAWDSMVHADSMALAGKPDIVRNLLRFFNETAGDHGFAFSFNRQLQPSKNAARPEIQMFYPMLLTSYFNMTGDAAAKERFLPLCKTIVGRADDYIGKGNLLVKDNNFYPDRPALMEITTNDWAIVNNELMYQGYRAWEELTGEGGDHCAALLRKFNETFWDAREGFWADSRDGLTGAIRPYYPSYGLFMVSRWALDPAVAKDNLKDVAAYMKKHYLKKYGISTMDLDSKGYMIDGTHCGSYRPCALRNYWNVMNAVGDVDSLADFRRILEAHWRTLTYPEGMLVEFANNDVRLNNDNPGAKQIFGAKAWLWDAFELNLGLKVLKDGLAFHAMGDGIPFSVENMLVRGKRLTVKVTGRGSNATYVFNGRTLEKPFLPYADLGERNELAITVR